MEFITTKLSQTANEYFGFYSREEKRDSEERNVRILFDYVEETIEEMPVKDVLEDWKDESPTNAIDFIGKKLKKEGFTDNDIEIIGEEIEGLNWELLFDLYIENLEGKSEFFNEHYKDNENKISIPEEEVDALVKELAETEV